MSASPSGVNNTLLLPLMLLTKTAKKKTLFAGIARGIHVCLRRIAGYTEQRFAFTHVQSVLWQSRDLNLRVERALKFLFLRNLYLKD